MNRGILSFIRVHSFSSWVLYRVHPQVHSILSMCEAQDGVTVSLAHLCVLNVSMIPMVSIAMFGNNCNLGIEEVSTIVHSRLMIDKFVKIYSFPKNKWLDFFLSDFYGRRDKLHCARSAQLTCGHCWVKLVWPAASQEYSSCSLKAYILWEQVHSEANE